MDSELYKLHAFQTTRIQAIDFAPIPAIQIVEHWQCGFTIECESSSARRTFSGIPHWVVSICTNRNDEKAATGKQSYDGKAATPTPSAVA